MKLKISRMAKRRRGRRCSVISIDGVPMQPVSIAKAIKTVLKGRAYIIETYPGQTIRSAGPIEMQIPKSIGVYHKAPESMRGPARLTAYALRLRDGGQCQYCGRTKLKRGEFFTRDHILPTSRGGKDEWDNVVLSCSKCNNLKDNRTPEEAGMKLLSQPYAPSRWKIEELKRRN